MTDSAANWRERLRRWWQSVTTPPVTVLDTAQADPFPLLHDCQEGPMTSAAVPPFKTGDYDLPDDVYEALEPLDGFPKGSRGGPRIYRYGRWWVVVSTSDFGDLLVGPWGVLHA